MNTHRFTEIFLRDLAQLKTEITGYKNEDNLWITDYAITNSAGNLCLHLVGSLDHFIGAVLGNTGYKRVRDDEFLIKNIDRKTLVARVEQTTAMVMEVLNRLSEKELSGPYPVEAFGTKGTIGLMLTQMAAHLNYHLGQINYHRRVFDTIAR